MKNVLIRPILTAALAAALAGAAQAARNPAAPVDPQAPPPSERAQAAAMDMIKACNQFPPGHPYSCEKLASMDLIRACSQFPTGHPMSCENLAALDTIKACNQFPPDHPKGCRALLSFVPKCPPGTVPGVDCRHLLVENNTGKSLLRDEKGRLPSVSGFSAVRVALDIGPDSSATLPEPPPDLPPDGD